MSFSLDDLKNKASESKEAITTRQKELYQYARDKGFNSYEAGVLRHKGKDLIDKLAAERDAKNG